MPLLRGGVIGGSQMPRHLIVDAHEWINEIPTVPLYYLAITRITLFFLRRLRLGSYVSMR